MEEGCVQERERERDLYLFRLRFSHLSDWEDAEVKRNAWIQRIALMFFSKKAYSIYGNKLPSDKKIIKSHSLCDGPLRLQDHLASVS